MSSCLLLTEMFPTVQSKPICYLSRIWNDFNFWIWMCEISVARNVNYFFKFGKVGPILWQQSTLEKLPFKDFYSFAKVAKFCPIWSRCVKLCALNLSNSIGKILFQTKITYSSVLIIKWYVPYFWQINQWIKRNRWLLKLGQSWPLFVYFCLLHITQFFNKLMKA